MLHKKELIRSYKVLQSQMILIYPLDRAERERVPMVRQFLWLTTLQLVWAFVVSAASTAMIDTFSTSIVHAFTSLLCAPL
jgi:hypothetical protein